MAGEPLGAGIAEAIVALRGAGVPVRVCAPGGATVYAVDRPAYRLEVIADPLRWLGLELRVLAGDGSDALVHRVDTDLYDISQPRYRWFADEIESEIVLVLRGLAQRRILVDVASPRPSMIVPGDGGDLMIKRRRFGATTSLHTGATPPGLTPLHP